MGLQLPVIQTLFYFSMAAPGQTCGLEGSFSPSHRLFRFKVGVEAQSTGYCTYSSRGEQSVNVSTAARRCSHHILYTNTSVHTWISTLPPLDGSDNFFIIHL